MCCTLTRLANSAQPFLRPSAAVIHNAILPREPAAAADDQGHDRQDCGPLIDSFVHCDSAAESWWSLPAEPAADSDSDLILSEIAGEGAWAAAGCGGPECPGEGEGDFVPPPPPPRRYTPDSDATGQGGGGSPLHDGLSAAEGAEAPGLPAESEEEVRGYEEQLEEALRDALAVSADFDPDEPAAAASEPGPAGAADAALSDADTDGRDSDGGGGGGAGAPRRGAAARYTALSRPGPPPDRPVAARSESPSDSPAPDTPRATVAAGWSVWGARAKVRAPPAAAPRRARFSLV